MINYESRMDPNTGTPSMFKILVASSGEELQAPIFVDRNKTECDNIPAEKIYEHLTNLLNHLKSKIETLEIIGADEPLVNGFTPIKGWSTISKLEYEISVWWGYVYFRDDNEPNENIILESP